MNRNARPKSRILAQVHETAMELQEIGLIIKRRIQEFYVVLRFYKWD